MLLYHWEAVAQGVEWVVQWPEGQQLEPNPPILRATESLDD